MKCLDIIKMEQESQKNSFRLFPVEMDTLPSVHKKYSADSFNNCASLLMQAARLSAHLDPGSWPCFSPFRLLTSQLNQSPEWDGGRRVPLSCSNCQLLAQQLGSIGTLAQKLEQLRNRNSHSPGFGELQEVTKPFHSYLVLY